MSVRLDRRDTPGQALCPGAPNTGSAPSGGGPNRALHRLLVNGALVGDFDEAADGGAGAVRVDQGSAAADQQVGDADDPEVNTEPGRPEVLGMEACNWAPENSSTSPGADSTISSWSGWWSMAPGRAWLSLVTCFAVVSRLALFWCTRRSPSCSARPKLRRSKLIALSSRTGKIGSHKLICWAGAPYQTSRCHGRRRPRRWSGALPGNEVRGLGRS